MERQSGGHKHVLYNLALHTASTKISWLYIGILKSCGSEEEAGTMLCFTCKSGQL